ncbi:DUF4249 domain-containing protein [Flavobacterium sp. JP2137]|uniref:DUF4249 domain-containing protein n=1 Tax=Flavobacterium sp. JP2137 TaxID=3414510 RepID=UPI003D2FF41B
MKTHIKIFFSLLLILGLTSCETVVDIDLPTAKPRLVVEANLDFDLKAPSPNQMIRLSLTTDFYAPEIPVVNQAEVSIESGAGRVYTFVEKAQSGEYHCDYFVPQLNETYTLRVVYNQETYEATEQLMEVPQIERVEQTITTILGTDVYEITTYFQDDPQADNYYLVRYELEGEKNSYSVFDDKFSQGNLMKTSYFNDELEIGDRLDIRLYGISKSYYNYMNTLLSITQGGGGPFDVPTGQVRGNVLNTTAKDNYALGFFRLTIYDHASPVVH